MKQPVRRAGAALALVSLAVANACYAYVPVHDDPAPSASGATVTTGDSTDRPTAAAVTGGDRVRVELTREGTTELARYLGPSVRVAEGTVSGIETDGAIAMAVEFVHLNSGVKMPWSGEGVVSIPAAMRHSLARHTFQKRQTIVTAAALTAALIGTAVLALRQGGAGGDGSGGPPPPPP